MHVELDVIDRFDLLNQSSDQLENDIVKNVDISIWLLANIFPNI